MATTTNFGWETPDDTDLVKDGALAIRTLGNSIDTSLVDLKGGTTGQVLSKTSNTDMDFTWVTSDDANAIQNAIVDAKGDLITATAADTPARLAVGSNGQILTADSTTATGLKWAASSAGSLTLLKSTTFSGAASVTEDSVFTSTYANYLMLVYVTSATGNGFLTLQFRAGGTTTTTNYNYYYYGYNGSAADNGSATAQSSMAIGYSASDAACSVVNIFSPQEAKNTYVVSQAFRAGAAANNFGANQTASTQFDGFVLDSGGNFTGTVRVYGYSNS